MLLCVFSKSVTRPDTVFVAVSNFSFTFSFTIYLASRIRCTQFRFLVLLFVRFFLFWETITHTHKYYEIFVPRQLKATLRLLPIYKNTSFIIITMSSIEIARNETVAGLKWNNEIQRNKIVYFVIKNCAKCANCILPFGTAFSEVFFLLLKEVVILIRRQFD